MPNGAHPLLGIPRAGSPASFISTSDAENGSDDENSNKRKLTNASAIASHLRPGYRGLGGRTWVMWPKQTRGRELTTSQDTPLSVHANRQTYQAGGRQQQGQ